MAISAGQIKLIWAKDPDKAAHALAEPLRDFGYNITDEYVKELLTKLYAGEKIENNVIAMFLQDWITKGMR